MGYSQFQKNSIDDIIRMFKKRNKVLLADEVGLGKTLIAAGVMEELFLKNDRSCGNVIYVAPSTLLINENIDKFKNKSETKKFNILSDEKINRPIKTIGQLAENKKDLCDEKINMFASSQGVLFATKSQEGDTPERTILVCIIKAVIDLRKDLKSRCENVDAICNSLEIINKIIFDLGISLQCKYDSISNTSQYKTIKEYVINSDIAVDIINSANNLIINESISRRENPLLEKVIEPETKIDNKTLSFFELIGMASVNKDITWLYSAFRGHNEYQDSIYDDKRIALINLIRLIVNITLIKHLNVRLIILDEFHKYFRKTEQNVLDLILHETECKLLMLSATPYRISIEAMLDDTDEGSKEEQPAFDNFKELLRYLFDEDSEYGDLLNKYISAIKDLSDSKEVNEEKWKMIIEAKEVLENKLKEVISRNERSECYKTETIIETKKYLDSETKYFVSELNTYKRINELLPGRKEKIPLGYVKEMPYPLQYADDYKVIKSIPKDVLKDRSLLFSEDRPVSDHFLLDVLLNRIKENKLNECLWIPPSCKKEDDISKILVFALYRASTKAIKDITNKIMDNTKCKADNSILNSIDVFDIKKYLPDCFCLENRDLTGLNRAFRNYFKIHIDVLVNAAIRDVAIRDIDSYCKRYALKEVLDEYAFIMDNNWDKFASGILSALKPETSMLVETIDEENDKNEVAERFQTPFYPFVLAATSSIQEGVDLHNYCLEIMHWHIPASPVEFEQREGRVDRRMSYLIRKRAWEKCVGCNINWDDVFNQVGDGFNGLQPYWYVPLKESGMKIRRIVAYHSGSKEEKKYDYLIKIKNYYRLSLGSGLEKEMLDKLGELLKDSDRSSKLFLSLKPYPKEGASLKPRYGIAGTKEAQM